MDSAEQKNVVKQLHKYADRGIKIVGLLLRGNFCSEI
jgi:hypothetical protein